MTCNYCCVYCARLLMMDRGTVRNMLSPIPKNKFEILVHLVGFITKRGNTSFSLLRFSYKFSSPLHFCNVWGQSLSAEFRCFRTYYQSRCQWTSSQISLKVIPKGCPKTLGTGCQSALCNFSEDRRSQIV